MKKRIKDIMQLDEEVGRVQEHVPPMLCKLCKEVVCSPPVARGLEVLAKRLVTAACRAARAKSVLLIRLNVDPICSPAAGKTLTPSHLCVVHICALLSDHKFLQARGSPRKEVLGLLVRPGPGST